MRCQRRVTQSRTRRLWAAALLLLLAAPATQAHEQVTGSSLTNTAAAVVDEVERQVAERLAVEREMARLTLIARGDIQPDAADLASGTKEEAVTAAALLSALESMNSIDSDASGRASGSVDDTITLPSSSFLSDASTGSGQQSGANVGDASSSSTLSLVEDVGSALSDISLGNVGSIGADADSAGFDLDSIGVGSGSTGSLAVDAGSDGSFGAEAGSVGSFGADAGSVGSFGADAGSVGSFGADAGSVGSMGFDAGSVGSMESEAGSAGSLGSDAGSTSSADSADDAGFASSDSSSGEERMFDTGSTDAESTTGPTTAPVTDSTTSLPIEEPAVSTVAPPLAEEENASNPTSEKEQVEIFSLLAAAGSLDSAIESSAGDSLASSNSSMSESKSKSEWSDSDDTTEAYTSNYCRCKSTECQNQYPGESGDSMCESKLSDGSCPTGYKTCVSTSSYKVTTSTSTPNSIAEASFTLLGSDIVGSFFNLGTEDPMLRGSKWWVTITLPSSWRFVAWEKTSVDVTLNDDDGEVSTTVRVHPCTDVTDTSNCDDSTNHRIGFVDVMDLIDDRTELMACTSRAPLSFVLTKSIVTGTSSTSSSVGVSVSLSYESSSGSLMSAATSRRMRELAVAADSTASSSASSSEAFSALALATMDLPSVESGRLDSSLLWVVEDTGILTLSFSTSTIVGPSSDNPQVCVNLRSSYCAGKGREPTSNVNFKDSASASYVQGGNPFLNLYGDPGETNLEIDSVNETYFCVANLIPSGLAINDSWEIRTTFTFQIQVSGVIWSGDEDDEPVYTNGFLLPTLGEITLMDNSTVMGTDCLQTLVNEKTYSKYTLSVYSVMSIVIFAVALVASILVTRMNGISFSGPTFYNDMTSISIMLIFLLSIVANAIWIGVSTNATYTSASHIYFLLFIIALCFSWTMMTSVCFHWGTVLYHDVRPIRRFLMLIIFLVINVAFYGIELFGVVALTDLYKCAYDDYLKNPLYNHRLCSNDYCPDLQPWQWRYAVDDVCKEVGFSSWFFPLLYGAQLLVFLSGITLLVLGGFVIRRGVSLIKQSGDIFDDHVVKVMKKSLFTYLVVILAIALVLGTSWTINMILYWKNWNINSVVWYTFTIWLPTLVPPAGFMLLSWNPRLHGMNWNPSLHVKDPQPLRRNSSGESGTGKNESGKFATVREDRKLSDGWAGILRFPDTEYNPIGQESVDGSQNVLALSVQLVSPVPIAHACFVELYVAENPAGEGGNDVTGEDDYYEDIPIMSYHRASISSMIQSGLHQEGILSRRSQSLSLLGTSTPTAVPATNTASTAKWSRVGFTETVLPTLVTGGTETGGPAVTQIATFLSVLQMPVIDATNPLLRFVVYEIPEALGSPDDDRQDPVRQLVRASSRQLDERARDARVSGMGLAPPSRPKVFCEFSCACSDMLIADEVNLVARQGSQRSRQSVAAVSSEHTSTEASPAAEVTATATPAPEVDLSSPHLRVKSMTVSPRTLKENTGFYITKSFQFAEGDEMVVEDMTESILTNELPRQYLELLVAERADDLARAQAEAADFETKCKSGLVGGLYDNLIEQIQGENDQTVVQSWLNERAQQRKMYVEALRECHQLCIDRAEEGLNFKASTEKKSLVLRLLPINLHVQDMWVGPTADLRSQRSRRTSSNVKAYPTVTAGAFAAHCFKFRHGGSILSLRAKLQKRSLSRAQSDISERSSTSTSSDNMDWSQASLRADDETLWHLTSRMDMCLSQALTTLVASFCRQLELAMQHPTDRQFLQVIGSVGFLLQIESLLSTQGKEIGMLEDFAAAVDALKHVTIVLDTTPPSHLPSTLLNLHMKNTTLPSVVSVRLSRGATRGTFTVAVGVRCSDEVLAAMPTSLKAGGAISVTPVIFTQGINEMQTLANNASRQKTTLQDIINRKSFALLTVYVDKYNQLATRRPDAVPTPMSTVTPLMESLKERIAAASKRQVVKAKHPKIIQESSRLCRLLGAGRVTSCKSAKDRTGMSVTLEQTRLLSEHHGLPEEFVVRTVSTMRSNGTRLENALKNTGKRQYAFNALQRSLLPDEYKCPEGTYGRGNVS